MTDHSHHDDLYKIQRPDAMTDEELIERVQIIGLNAYQMVKPSVRPQQEPIRLFDAQGQLMLTVMPGGDIFTSSGYTLERVLITIARGLAGVM